MTTPTPAERHAAYTYIVRKWKDAHSIRFAGKCHQCKKRTEWSYQLPGDEIRIRVSKLDGQEMEDCGYVCTNCGWGNGGSRPVENDELDGDE